MPTSRPITVSRIGTSIVATDGALTRQASCSAEPEAKHLLTRLQSDRRAAYRFLHEGEIGDCC